MVNRRASLGPGNCGWSGGIFIKCSVKHFFFQLAILGTTFIELHTVSTKKKKKKSPQSLQLLAPKQTLVTPLLWPWEGVTILSDFMFL